MRKMWLWCSLVCAPALMCQPGIFLSKRPLLLTANTLTVDLNDVQATKEWVVSVDTDNEKPPTVALGSGNFEPTATKGPRMVKKMGNLPPGQYDILPSSVILKMKGSPHEAILVHAVVPSGTQVKCMVNGKVISDSSVVSSLLIRSGVIINEKTSFSSCVEIGNYTTSSGAGFVPAE